MPPAEPPFPTFRVSGLATALHRVSGLATAVIEKGRILESGTHEELLTAKGHYHALYTRQFQQDREAGLFETSD